MQCLMFQNNLVRSKFQGSITQWLPSSKIFGTIRPAMQHHIPEELDLLAHAALHIHVCYLSKLTHDWSAALDTHQDQEQDTTRLPWVELSQSGCPRIGHHPLYLIMSPTLHGVHEGIPGLWPTGTVHSAIKSKHIKWHITKQNTDLQKWEGQTLR